MFRKRDEWEEIIRKAVTKLENGQELDESELEGLVNEVEYTHVEGIAKVTEIEGTDHRWQREMTTIIKTNGRYWRIDWMRGLTESQEDDWWEQPVEVKPEKRLVPEHYETVYVEVNQ